MPDPAPRPPGPSPSSGRPRAARRLAAWLAGPLLAIALMPACGPTPPAPGGASPRVTASARPGPTATPKATATPAAVPTPARLLQKPGRPFVEVTGEVRMDAAYGVARAGATLVSDQGGSVLRLAGSTGLVAETGGNVVANNGGALLAINGAGILSNNGGGLVANNGGSIVSDNGAGAVGATGPARHALLQAPPAPGAALAPGTALPTAGMAVVVVDPRTGEPLPLGEDAAGQPVTAVVTDAAGRFRIFPPRSASATLYVAAAPAAGTEARLGALTFVRPEDTALRLDDDATAVANYVRLTFVSDSFRGTSAAGPDASTDNAFTAGAFGLVDPAGAAALTAATRDFTAFLRELGTPGWPAARREALAFRIVDVVLSHLDLPAIPSVAAPGATPIPAGEKAIDRYARVVGALNRRVGTLMAAHAAAGKPPEAFFADKPYVQAAVARDNRAYAFLKPADFTDFLIRAYVANPTMEALARYADIFMIKADPALAPFEDTVPAELGLLSAYARAFADPAVQAELKAAVRAFAAAGP